MPNCLVCKKPIENGDKCYQIRYGVLYEEENFQEFSPDSDLGHVHEGCMDAMKFEQQ